ncbi:hypothetical protein LSAT2_031286, partial [Lamellibrachia satsuma]
MASNIMDSVVELTVNDVPGAAFMYSDIEKHSVLQLRRWLECRGMKRSGTKSLLLERCRAVIAANKQHIIDPSVDGGKWHDIVTKCRRDAQPNQTSPPTPPTVGWQKFPCAVVPPNFNKGHIYHYLVETLQTANFDDGNSDIDPDSPSDTVTSKPLHRGELYYTSGHVTGVTDVRSDNAYFVMAEVFASTKKVAYTVTVTLSTNSGFV